MYMMNTGFSDARYFICRTIKPLIKSIQLPITTILLSILMTACSNTKWCDTKSAEKLRERTNVGQAYSSIRELFNIKPGDPIAVFAHRGGYHCEESDQIPENSIPNVEKAIQMGFDGYETDLLVTKDKKFIIHHDDTLDRTTTGTGDVSAITLEQARKLNLKYPSGEISNEKIPTFRELLLAGQGQILFLVELKATAPKLFPELVNIIHETNSADKVLFWIDWNIEDAKLFEQHIKSGLKEAETNVLWRARNIDSLNDIAKRFKPLMVDIPPTLKELSNERKSGRMPQQHASLVSTAQNLGIKVMASKIGTDSYLKALLARDVQVFMTRSPEVQLSYLIENGLHR